MSSIGTLAGAEHSCNAVISTALTPHLPMLVPDMAAAFAERINAIHNIPLDVRQSEASAAFERKLLDKHNDPVIEIPGVIEHMNLIPMSMSMRHATFHMPKTHSKWSLRNDQLTDKVLDHPIEPSHAFDPDCTGTA